MVTEGVELPVGWIPTLAVDPLNTDALNAFYAAGPRGLSYEDTNIYDRQNFGLQLKPTTFWTSAGPNTVQLTGLGSARAPVPIDFTSVFQFNPASLISVAGGFWRADMGVAGTSVTGWADQSGFGNTMTVNTNSPTLSQTSFNNKPGITFADSTPQGLATGLNFPGTLTVSTFALIKLSNNVGAIGNGRFHSLVGAGNAEDYNNTSSFTVFGDFDDMHFVCDENNNTIGNGGVSIPLTPGNFYLMGMVFDGTNGNSWLNGTVQDGGTPVSDLLGAPPAQFSVGNSVGGSLVSGHVLAFAGITQKALTQSDWTNLKNWCNQTWGMSF